MPKDHLVYTDDAVRSVLLGATVKTMCGLDRQFTREDFENRDYNNTCKHCMAAAAEAAAPEAVQINPKLGWTDLLERAWVALNEQAARSRNHYWAYTATSQGTWTAAYKWGVADVAKKPKKEQNDGTDCQVYDEYLEWCKEGSGA